MARKSSGDSKARILEAAEALFAEHGFSATSVDAVAKKAGVNKALIYYYFKDKNALIQSLFEAFLQEVMDKVRPEGEPRGRPGPDQIRSIIAAEIQRMESKKQLLSIMLMEAFKHGEHSDFLFTFAKTAMRHAQQGDENSHSARYWLFEFFTGFLASLTFVTLKDKWCRHFSCDPDAALDHFLDVFITTHFQHHDEFD
ncbi:MAG: TetR/AcrR family transcriptional regulator [Desulfovibrio sp.]|nr:MAG: TetR/AcrR family transcriptional regulator [Desulfovibrio sp.]